MDRKRLGIFGGVIMAMILSMVFYTPDSRKEVREKTEMPVVSVSIFPLFEIARTVAAETLHIQPIIPLGADAHVFSPNPRQVADMSKSVLFIYNGAGFESWAENLKHTLPSGVGVVDMSRHVTLLKHEEEDHEDQDHAADHPEEEEAHHDHGGVDPHYWLDIDNMIRMTRVIESEFSRIRPENATLYRQNATAYIAELQQLKTEYEEGLRECKNRVLVSNHDAFGYLARANALETVSVIGLSTDEQPSAKNISDIITVIQEHGVKTVFFEALVNDNVAQTLARETGARAQSLQPLANISEDELKSHETYLSIMRSNLAKLRDAMECR